MKSTYLLGLLILALLIAIPASEAMMQFPGKPTTGIITKSQPFKYADIAVNPGEMYVLYLTNITMQGNKPFADLIIKIYDKNGVLQMSPHWKASVGNGAIFNGGQGPRFTVEKIWPARCLPRTNKCSEDAVLISVA